MRRYALLLACVLTFGQVGLAQAAAASKVLTYSATANQYPNVKFAPGESRTVKLIYKNTGTATWTAGQGKTAVYLVGNSSVLGSSAWVASDEPGLIDQKTVKPGAQASATFLIHAPSVPGRYSEKFMLSYGPNQWIKGSTTNITFVVGSGVTPKGVVKPTAPSVTASAPLPIPVLPATSHAVPTSVSLTSSAPSSPVLDPTEWKAQIVTKGGLEFQIDPETRGQATVVFKNVGKTTWTSQGPNEVDLRQGGGDEDQFVDSEWPSEMVASDMKESSVKPGGTGTFTVVLRAPDAPGSYTVTFDLTAASGTPMTGGSVGWSVRVPETLNQIAEGIPDDATPSAAAAQARTYTGQLLLRSATALTLLGDGREGLTFGFKNTGTAIWNSLSLQLTGVTPLLQGKQGWVRDDSWIDSLTPSKTNSVTAPGQIGFIGFTIKAPLRKGSYHADFQLKADGQSVMGAIIDIPITVTADGYITQDDLAPTPSAVPTTASSPSTSTTPPPTQPTAPPPVVVSSSGVQPAPLNGDTSGLPAEPIIRVGLYRATNNQMEIKGVSTGYGLYANGTKVCTLNQNDVLTVSYDRASATYHASGPGCSVQGPTVYVAETPDDLAPMEIVDYTLPIGWLPGANDNLYRAKIELRYTPATDSVWVINELPIEYYLDGLAETSDVSPMEYQKALLTAARTYAMYHYDTGTKHADEDYTVDATYDQVYHGYASEARSPHIVAAVTATRGQIVTYNGTLALTPYFARSDGRTRSWGEVWYGGSQYPWLVSVPVPEDAGKTLWGHGVGMSATGALSMAAHENKTYDQILKYFYTGTELRVAYQ